MHGGLVGVNSRSKRVHTMKEYDNNTGFLHILRAIAIVSVITLHVGSGNNTRQDIITRGLFTAINV